MRWGRFLRRAFLAVLVLLVGLPAALLALYRVVSPPVTPLMVIRMWDGADLRQRWVPLERISPHLIRSVIASEDAKFCEHDGFDWDAVNDAIDDYRRGDRLRGASTITMQTAKNLFLWPDRTWLRKGFEAYLTVMMEAIWDKRRILETYLNIVEWGDGLYGAEAAARVHFRVPASDLSRRQGALMAAVLPNPLRWSPNRPTDYISRRAGTIATRARSVSLAKNGGCP